MANVNIFGSCVTRDIFQYEWSQSIKVKKYISRVTVMSSISDYIEFENVEEILKEYSSQYLQRMLVANLNKEVFNILKYPVEYLMIDMIDERFPIVEIKRDGKTNFFTDVSGVAKTKEWANRLFSDCQLRFIRQDELSDEIIENAMKEFSKRITECIEPEKIILHKAFFVEEYVDRQKERKRFGDKVQEHSVKVNADLKRKYELLKRYIPECREVQKDMPVFADEMHKWGLAPMHYTEEYYHEIFDKIQAIIK